MIELIIEGKKLEFLIDTGFNGYLVLSKRIIDKMNLEIIGLSDYTTASGESKETEIYKVRLNFFDEEIEIPVLSTDANFSLVGMELLNACKIIIEKQRNLVEITKTNA